MPVSLLVEQDISPSNAVEDRSKDVPAAKALPVVNDVSALREELEKVQQDYFDKEKEHKLTIDELRHVNTTLQSTKKGYDIMFLSLKEEKEAAEKIARDAENELKVALTTANSLEADILESDIRYQRDLHKMEEMQSELNKWENCYESAVKASKADASEKYKVMKGERDRALSEVDKLKKSMEESNATIGQLGEEIKQKDLLKNELMKELQETKEKLQQKTDELERVKKSLRECKSEISSVIKVCRKDAASAQKKIATVKGQRNEAFTKIGILEKQMEVLNQLVGCLEEDNNNVQRQNESFQTEVESMKEQLARSRGEFEMALTACKCDLFQAENELRFYVEEKESALADAKLARMQLKKLGEVVSNLEKERDFKRETSLTPWWKKFFPFSASVKSVNF